MVMHDNEHARCEGNGSKKKQPKVKSLSRMMKRATTRPLGSYGKGEDMCVVLFAIQ